MTEFLCWLITNAARETSCQKMECKDGDTAERHLTRTVLDPTNQAFDLIKRTAVE